MVENNVSPEKHNIKDDNLEKIPELRFPEFNDKYDINNLGDISEVTKLAGFEFTEYVTYSDVGNIIALRGLNIKDNKIDLKDIKYIDNSDFSKLERSKLYEGDLLFTYVGTIGEVALITENDKFYLAPNVCRIRSNKLINNEFLKFYFNSYNLAKEVRKYVTKSSQPALSMENIRKFKIVSPTISEQKKIANFLSSIDKKIELLEKKYKHYINFFKFLSNLFLNNNLNNNMYKKLGDLADISTGNKDLKDAEDDGKYPFFVRSANIERINSYSNDGEAILIPGDGKIGEVYHYINGKFDYHQRVYKISDFEDILGKYVYYYLKQHFLREAKRNSVKATVDSLRLPTIKNMKIYYPSTNEQQKIINNLDSVTLKLNLIEEEIEKMKSFKKGLLQQMFV